MPRNSFQRMGAVGIPGVVALLLIACGAPPAQGTAPATTGADAATSGAATIDVPAAPARSEPAEPERPLPLDVRAEAPTLEDWLEAPIASMAGDCTMRRISNWFVVSCTELRVPFPNENLDGFEANVEPLTLVLSEEPVTIEFGFRVELLPGQAHHLVFKAAEGGGGDVTAFLAWPTDASVPSHVVLVEGRYRPERAVAQTLDTIRGDSRPSPGDWAVAKQMTETAADGRCFAIARDGWVRATCKGPDGDEGFVMVTPMDLGEEDTDHFISPNIFLNESTVELQLQPGHPQGAAFAWGEAIAVPYDMLSPTERIEGTALFLVEWPNGPGSAPRFKWR